MSLSGPAFAAEPVRGRDAAGERPNVLLIAIDDLNDWNNLADKAKLDDVKRQFAAWLPATNVPDARPARGAGNARSNRQGNRLSAVLPRHRTKDGYTDVRAIRRPSLQGHETPTAD